MIFNCIKKQKTHTQKGMKRRSKSHECPGKFCWNRLQMASEKGRAVTARVSLPACPEEAQEMSDSSSGSSVVPAPGLPAGRATLCILPASPSPDRHVSVLRFGHCSSAASLWTLSPENSTCSSELFQFLHLHFFFTFYLHLLCLPHLIIQALMKT